MVQGPLRLVEA